MLWIQKSCRNIIKIFRLLLVSTSIDKLWLNHDWAVFNGADSWAPSLDLDFYLLSLFTVDDRRKRHWCFEKEIHLHILTGNKYFKHEKAIFDSISLSLFMKGEK